MCVCVACVHECDRNVRKRVNGICLQSLCPMFRQRLVIFIALFHVLQDGLNALHLAVIGNHVDVVRALVGEVGLSVTHRDNVSTKGSCYEAVVTTTYVIFNYIR